MQNAFSINRAAELVERDRRTLKRVLRDVRPDANENGRPRWRLRTVIDALAVHEHQNMAGQNGGYASSEIADQCDAAFAEFDRRFDEMKAGRSLKARRTLAIVLAPFIAETIRLMRQRDTADGLHTDHVALRADRIFMLLMIRFCDPCRWSKEQAWKHLDATGDENLDAN
jgi:hypothetical protein